MERITQSDLANRLAALRTAAVSAGLTEAERWHVDIGSKTYGRAYRLWLKHTDYPNHSGHYSPIVHDYLGMTANEAYATMGTLLDAFHAVASVRKGSYHDHTREDDATVISGEYERGQLARVLADGPADGEDFYRLKVAGKSETRWLNLGPAQVERLADVWGDDAS